MRFGLLGTGLACVLAGCGSGTATGTDGSTSLEAGALIATDSLTTFNGQALPCCRTDSAQVKITTTGGFLRFYASAHYDDSVMTPGGMAPRACVQELPNGAHLALNHLLTLSDGSSYLLLPCSTGVYRVSVMQLVEMPGGSSSTREVIVASGTYTWAPNTLSLSDHARLTPPLVSMAGAVIAVNDGGTRYEFVAVRGH